MNYDFDMEFQTDEEVEYMLDGVISSIGNSIFSDEEKPAILALNKLQQMQFTYKVMKYLTRNTDAKVTYLLHEPFRSMGSVSVECKTLKIANPEWLSKAAEFASNTEIYPMISGNIKLTFTFHGLVKPIE